MHERDLPHPVFYRKSAEAVVINNRGMGYDGVSIQVRIGERSVPESLDDFTENIGNQILNAAGCGNCSSRCRDVSTFLPIREANIQSAASFAITSALSIFRTEISGILCVLSIMKLYMDKLYPDNRPWKGAIK